MTPPYLRDVDTKRVYIFTDQLARMVNMEPFYPKDDSEDPCKIGAKLAAEGKLRTDSNPLVDHTPPPAQFERSREPVAAKAEPAPSKAESVADIPEPVAVQAATPKSNFPKGKAPKATIDAEAAA